MDNHLSNSLNYRNHDLSASDVASIALELGNKNGIKSASFSYNDQLGDEGAIALAKYLPKSLHELGLVGCGIGDTGGRAILEWMKHSPDLRMVCIEQNSLSQELKSAFREFSQENPQVLVVV